MKKSKYAAAALFYMSAVPMGAKSEDGQSSNQTFIYSEDRTIDSEDLKSPRKIQLDSKGRPVLN